MRRVHFNGNGEFTMSNITKPPAAEKTALASLKERIESPDFTRELTRIVGTAVGADRVQRMVLTSIARNPGIAECTTKSIINAIYQATQLGLPLDGRHAHLVPFREGDRKTCTLVPDYKGLLMLAIKSGSVMSVNLEKVCENDDFEWDRGTIVRHRIDFRKPRGEAYAWYAIAKLAGGGEASCVIPRDEMEALRARVKKGDKRSPWDTDFDEMAKKSCFKRLSKVLPMTPEYAEAERLADDEPVDVTPKTAVFEKPQGKPQLPEPTSDDGDLGPVATEQKPVATEPTSVAAPAEQAPVEVVSTVDDPGFLVLALKKGFARDEVDGYLLAEGFIGAGQTFTDVSPNDAAKLMKNQVGFLSALGKRRAAAVVGGAQ